MGFIIYFPPHIYSPPLIYSSTLESYDLGGGGALVHLPIMKIERAYSKNIGKAKKATKAKK